MGDVLPVQSKARCHLKHVDSNPNESRIRIQRRLLLGGGIAYFLWWFLVESMLPGSYNPMGSRLFVVSLYILAWLASFRLKWIEEHLSFCFYVCSWILTFHYFYLFHHNSTDINWVIGCYITIVGLCACFHTGAALISFGIYAMALSIGITLLDPVLYKSIFFSGMVTILAFVYFGLRLRLKLLSQIHEQSQKILLETQRREKNRILLEASREALALRNEFILVASHELKTPLTTIKMLTQIAEKNMAKGDPEVYSPARVKKTTDLIGRQADRLERLVEDMLDISKISLGKVSMEFSVFDLSALVEEVVSSLSEAFAESHCRIELNLTKGVTIRADAFRVEQVVVNLLTNAMKYAKGKPVHILVEAQPPMAILSVQDEGIGIAPENQLRIFHKFERAVSARYFSGFGLGLFISKYIVEAHHGHIEVVSEAGKGARFTVRLPAWENRL